MCGDRKAYKTCPHERLLRSRGNSTSLTLKKIAVSAFDPFRELTTACPKSRLKSML